MEKYIHSHFGVYALIFNEDKTSILVIKKARGPYTGMLDLPGGSPEKMELLEETLERELLEETNCTTTSYHQLGGFSTLFSYKKEGGEGLLRHLGVIFTAEISGTPRTEPDGHDSNGCVWFSINDLTEKNATPFVHMALDTASHAV